MLHPDSRPWLYDQPGRYETLSRHPVSLYRLWRRGRACHVCGYTPERIRQAHACWACDAITDFMDNRPASDVEAVEEAEAFNDELAALYARTWREREAGLQPGLSVRRALFLHDETLRWQERLHVISSAEANGDFTVEDTLAGRAWTVCQHLGAAGRMIVCAVVNKRKPPRAPLTIAGYKALREL